MSDFAEGWLLWGTARASVLAALKEEHLAAFVAHSTQCVTVFPSATMKNAARISKRLPEAALIAFLAGDDTGEVRLLHQGCLQASLKTKGRPRVA